MAMWFIWWEAILGFCFIATPTVGQGSASNNKFHNVISKAASTEEFVASFLRLALYSILFTGLPLIFLAHADNRTSLRANIQTQ
jgi:hypothetical protein